MHEKTLMAWLSLGLLLSTGCTSVLGMERAELDTDAGSGNGGTAGTGSALPPTVYPISACDVPAPDCPSCLNGSGNELTRCLASKTCRKALYDYRSCTGNHCTEFNAACADRYLGQGDDDARVLDTLLTDTCADQCLGTAVASMCELYCACMGQNCPGRLSDCMAQCAAVGDLDNVYCRWMHCEFATPENPQHCQHAVGEMGFCPRTSSRPDSTCTNRVHSGFPCTAPADCCSGTCGGAPSGVCD